MDFLKRTLMFFVLIATLSASAQKLEYWDFKATNEATARLQGTSVTDDNTGKKAALIKIYTPFHHYDLGFDAGLFQILGRKQAAPGEIWLYVPERTQKVTVSHPTYGPVEIWFDGMEAEAGKTYSVELNVEGRNVALIASKPNSEIWIDGESKGKSPINMRLPLGMHTVRAELGTFLYDDIINVSQDGADHFTLQMEDQSLLFGDVDIEVEKNAEIWIDDKMMGSGSVRKHLKAGEYVVTTKLPDHDDRTTRFSVDAGKSKYITATPPAPHIGYIDIKTVPLTGVTVTMADTLFRMKPQKELPVADYRLNFYKKGYIPKSLDFRIQRNKTFSTTVLLERIQYVKKNSGYASVYFRGPVNMSVGIALGGYFENINLEASYNLGLGWSKDVEWFDLNDHVLEETCKYRIDEMAVRLGYQLRFAQRFGLTPQAGFLLLKLSAKDNNQPGNGFTQSYATIGARFIYNPIQHFGFFVTPEFLMPLGYRGNIENIFEQGGISPFGLRISIGVAISI